MIDFSQYDISKIKEEDKVLFSSAEFMNELEWQRNRPLWHKIIFPFYPAPMPKELCLSASYQGAPIK